MASAQARFLRTNQTPAEQALWNLLRKRQITGHRFRRQHSIGPFIVDFVCLERRVIVEADGSVHEDATRQREDIERDRWLASQRFRILRLTNEQILSDPEAALLRVQAFLGVTAADMVHLPLPSPPLLRGRDTSRRIAKRFAKGNE